MYKRIVNKLLNEEPNETVVLHQLMMKPKPEKNDDMPKFHNFVKNNTHQSDLLFLPENKSYKYLLVVVDESTRLIDCEPLKNKESINIVKAFKKIYSRNILSIPKHLVDGGVAYCTYFNNY